MKWYERQKQLFAKKNEPETPSQPKEPIHQEKPPIHQERSYDNNTMQNAQPYEAQSMQPPYEEPIVQEQPQYEPQMNEQAGYAETRYAETEVNEPVYDTPPANESYQQPIYSSAKNEKHEATTISQGTLINGNIESDGDLIIYGHVRGDVLCNANLSIYGVVEGIISCNNAYLDNATVIGDIGCSGNIELTQSSTIDGNVEAYDLLSGGRIKGNATVGEAVHFTATSVIVGDISANQIEVERGAIIQGNTLIRQEIYFDQR